MAQKTASSTSRLRKIIFAVVAVVVVLAIALGVGLGVGLKHNGSSTSASPNTSGSGSSGNGTISNSTSGPTVFVNRTAAVLPQNFMVDSARLNSVWNSTAAPQTRTYNWTVEEIWSNPGHVWKKMLMVNRQSPGPLIEANLGDTIVVYVKNALSTNETTIHWHGQYQNGTNFMDGTQGITQCGIPPGETMKYEWVVQNVGTYWWHAHSSMQYTDGLIGGLVLHSPNETASQYSISNPTGGVNSTITTRNTSLAGTGRNGYDGEALFLLSDLYNTNSFDLLWRYMLNGTGLNGQPGDEPVPDGGFINGVSQSSCAYYPAINSTLAASDPVFGENTTCVSTDGSSTPYWSIDLIQGSTYRFRLINTGTFAATTFSIDNHTLTVVEADGVSVEPVTVQTVKMAVAQRYSVLVTLNQSPGAYWVRNTVDTSMFSYTNPNFTQNTYAVLRYNGTSTTALPAAPLVQSNLRALNFSVGGDLVPADPISIGEPTVTNSISVYQSYRTGGPYKAYVNETSWTPLTNQFTLQNVFTDAAQNVAYNDASQLMLTTNGIHVVEVRVTNQDDSDHPFHMHGTTFWVLAQGTGSFVGGSLNGTNPMRRDTVIIPAYSYIVMRFISDNPGAWAFHCHISWHMEIGLLMQFVNIPSTDSLNTMNAAIPQDLKEMCNWTTANASGLVYLDRTPSFRFTNTRFPRMPKALKQLP